ncbi:phosphate-binding protein PstS precursor [bacterium BMS3Bbin02]|nr:phosphate-binding protein PstS precursor [bacterium BMS3Bbin02]
MKSRFLKPFTLSLALAVVATACAASASTPSPTSSASSTLSGSVLISGSSTIEPITALNAEKFNRDNPNVSIAVEGPGTGDGFKKFCAGETDISDASRRIKAAEAEACAAAGVSYVELEIAVDGISVLTGLDNDISCLAFKDLYALLGSESTGFTSWSDADDLAAELGSVVAPYPDVPLTITAPGEESGTYDTFISLALSPVAKARDTDKDARPDYVASPNDNVIIQGLSSTPTSLGWVGYAFYVANQNKVKALEIDGGEGCVFPSINTIQAGTYPLARSLYLYVNTAKAAEKPEVAAYVDFYLSPEGLRSVSEAAYIPLDSYDETVAAWNER